MSQPGPTWCTRLPASIRPPDGRDAAYRFAEFDPVQHWRGDGTFSPLWEIDNVVRIGLPASLHFAGLTVARIAVHRKVSGWMSEALKEIYKAGLWQWLDPYGGGFAVRAIRGEPDKLSLHAVALATDWNPLGNPLGRLLEQCAWRVPEGERIIEIFESWGFLSGAHFEGRKDVQHVQWATGV